MRLLPLGWPLATIRIGLTVLSIVLIGVASMSVEKQEDASVLETTTPDATEVDKLRALGYMGLRACSTHHQRHHLHPVKGKNPHHVAGENASAAPSHLFPNTTPDGQ